MSKLTYNQRLSKGVMQLIEMGFMEASQYHVYISHDDWCLSGNPGHLTTDCNCNPDIVVVIGKKKFDIDKDGNAIEVAAK